MRFEFPKIKWKVVDVEVSPNYIHRTTVVTRQPWFRLIWSSSQRTIMLGKYRIGVEVIDPAKHMAEVEAHSLRDQEWYER